MLVVLPVPGPPVSTMTLLRLASATAPTCSGESLKGCLFTALATWSTLSVKATLMGMRMRRAR